MAGTSAYFEKAVVEGFEGGLMSSAGGGRFGDGFLGAAVGSLDEPLLADIGTNTVYDRIAQAAVAATIGGTLSEVTGGNFGNGAVTAAFQNLFNAQEHEEEHEVTVSEPAGQGENIFNHITISVDGSIPVGFDPAKDLTAAQVLKEVLGIDKAGTPGVVEPDPGQKITDTVTLPVSRSNALLIQKYIQLRTETPGNYQEMLRNCAQFVEDALQHGGINVPATYNPNKLMYEMHAYPQQQTYTPAPPP